jgi:hypothetical protein
MAMLAVPQDRITRTGLPGLRGLGLGPDDPCYDQNHPWYLPNFLSNSVECACMQQNWKNYDAGQQCIGYCVSDPSAPIAMQCVSAGGVAQTMGQQVGAVVSGVVGGGFKGATQDLTSSTGLILIAAAGILAVMLVTR